MFKINDAEIVNIKNITYIKYGRYCNNEHPCSEFMVIIGYRVDGDDKEACFAFGDDEEKMMKAYDVILNLLNVQIYNIHKIVGLSV